MGPSRPLCPGKAIISIFSFLTSRSITPAPCAASTKKILPLRAAISPTSFKGILLPQMLDAAVIIIIAVFDLVAFSIMSGETHPSLSAITMVCCTPCLSMALSGRSTELCSMDVVTTWSPFFRNPCIPRFKASVVFFVNTTLWASWILKISATFRRARYTSSPVLRDILCPDRPGFPQYCVMHSSITSAIPAGLGKEVAPLSKYIINLLLT